MPHVTAASASTSRTAVAYVVITTSAPAISAASCAADDRDGAVVDDDAQPGHEAGGLGSPVADDRGRGDDERRVLPGRARQLGEHGRRLAEPHVERQAAAELGRVEEADPRQRLGLVGAQLADEALRPGDRRHRRRAGTPEDVVGPAVALDDDAATQPGPVETDAVAQDLGAGELRDRLALGERGRRLFEVDPIDLDPAAAGLHERARLAGQSRHVGGGELDVVEQHRPRHVAELVGADHRVPPASRRRAGATGVGLRSDSFGTRTSNPTAASVGPMTVMNSHASSWLSATCPRRRTPDRLRAGNRRSRRAHSPATCRPPRSARSAASIGTRSPLADGALTVTSHTPPGPGAIELHDEPRPRRRRDGARPLVERPRHVGRERGRGLERSRRPSGRSTASPRSVAVFAVGGWAGSSMRSTLSVTIASTTAVITAVVVARPSPPSIAATVPGIAAASATIAGLSTSAGFHRTATSTTPALGTLRDAEARHDRTGGGQSDSFERDVPEPEHARSDAVPAVATADGDEPAERILHRDRQRVGTHPAGQRRRSDRSANRAAALRSLPSGPTARRSIPASCPALPPRRRRDRRPTTLGAAPHPARGPRRRPRGRRRVSAAVSGGGGRRIAAVARRL